MTISKKPIVTKGRRYDFSPSEAITFLFSAAETASQLDFAEMEVKHFGGPPLHVHPLQEEIHYVIQGQLKYQISEETFELHRGDCAYIPSGIPHSWINLQKEPARILGLLSPGGGEIFFKTMAASANEMDAEAIATLAQEYGTDIVGPPLATLLTDQVDSR